MRFKPVQEYKEPGSARETDMRWNYFTNYIDKEARAFVRPKGNNRDDQVNHVLEMAKSVDHHVSALDTGLTDSVLIGEALKSFVYLHQRFLLTFPSDKT